VKPALQPIRTPRRCRPGVRLAHLCFSIIRHRRPNRDPLFSIDCALSVIRSFVYPHYFVAIAHSLPKTPGGWCDRGLFNQILVTPIESYSFTRIAPKPNGILLFHQDPGGGGALLLPFSTFDLSRSCRPSISRLGPLVIIWISHDP